MSVLLLFSYLINSYMKELEKLQGFFLSGSPFNSKRKFKFQIEEWEYEFILVYMVSLISVNYIIFVAFWKEKNFPVTIFLLLQLITPTGISDLRYNFD